MKRMTEKATRWIVTRHAHPAPYCAASWQRKLTTGVDTGGDSKMKGLRRAVEDLQMAIEGYDWVEASADAAYLECDATQRGPRAKFKLDAARTACGHLERALSDTGKELDVNVSHGTSMSLDGRLFIARLMNEGHNRLHRLQTDAKAVEQLLLSSPTPTSVPCNKYIANNDDDDPPSYTK